METLDVLPEDVDKFVDKFDVAPQQYMTVRSTKASKAVNFRTMKADGKPKASQASMASNFKQNAMTRRIGSFMNRKKREPVVSEGAKATVEYFQKALGKSQQAVVVRTKEEVAAERKVKEGTPKFILHPYNSKRIVWDLLSMALLLYSIVTVPVKIAFNFSAAQGCSTSFSEQRWHWYTDLLVDFAFMVDVVINLRTAFWHPTIKSQLVTDPKLIFFNYLRGFLIFDLISAVPMDLILLPYGCDADSTGSVNNVARTPAFIKRIRMLRVIRLLRITRIKRLLERIRDTLHINPGVLRLIKFAFFVSLVAHYDACIFFWIGEQEKTMDPFQSWTISEDGFLGGADIAAWTVEEPLAVEALSISSQYLVSLYWAATTLTTVGFGDITPVTTWEIGFSMFVIIQGGVALGYVVGSMADLLSRLNMRKKRHLEKVEYWESAFHRGRFPASLRRKIRGHHEYVFRNRISKLPEFAEEELSRSLLRDITAHIYKEALGSLPMFNGLSDEVITELALALDHVQLPPGETLYREGDDGDCMYFLQRGDVQLTMLLMSESFKQSLVKRDVQEFIERVGETVNQREHLHTDSVKHHAEPADLAGVKTYRKDTNIAKYMVQVGDLRCAAFKWGINQRTCSYFGESVLFSRSGKRLSSAVTVTGCTLLVLTAKSMEFVCRKYPSMREVSQRMQHRTRPKLVQAVDRVVHTLRSRGDLQCRLYVSIHEAVNLPKMDNFGGRCDAYGIVDVGPAREGKLRYETLKVYNTYSPTWNETFQFPIKDVYTPGSAVVNLELVDWDLVGEHDYIGFCRVDLSEAAIQAWEKGVEEHHAPQWFNINFETQKGKLKGVKGHNRKQAKVKLSFRMVPPPGGKEAAEARRSRNPSLAGSHTAGVFPGCQVPAPTRARSAPHTESAAATRPVVEPAELNSRQRSSSMDQVTGSLGLGDTEPAEHNSAGDTLETRAEYKPQSARRAVGSLGESRYAILEVGSAANSVVNSPRQRPHTLSAPPSIPDLDGQVSRTSSGADSTEVWQRQSAGGDPSQDLEVALQKGIRSAMVSGDVSVGKLKARAQREVERLEEAGYDEDDVDVVSLRRMVRKLRTSAKLGWNTVQGMVSRFETEEQQASQDQQQLLELLRMLQATARNPEARKDDVRDVIVSDTH